MKVIFTPVFLIAGVVAAMISKKVFERVWAMIDEEDPPQPDQREVNWPKLIGALVIEGAVFRLIKGLTDHGARVMVQRYARAWPGEEAG